MPRYYFHVCDGQDFRDLQGTDLRGLTEAKTEALRFAGALLRDQTELFWHHGEWHMRVTDALDMTLFQLTFLVTEAPALMEDGPFRPRGASSVAAARLASVPPDTD